MKSSERRIGVVIGSTRPERICPDVTNAYLARVPDRADLRYEVIDLAEVALPMLDEPLMAALGEYAHEHTREWSRRVASYDGFVFVFPQYNWGYPAVLKNALDYLYAEWAEKPATTLTYGTRGGGKGADQLGQVMRGLKMAVMAERIEVSVSKNDLTDRQQLADPAALMARYQDRITAVDTAFQRAFALRTASE